MKKEFIVPDMTCGHCVTTITKTIQELVPDAVVTADTDTHWLTVEANQIEAQEIMMRLQAVGFNPQLA